MIKEAGAIHSQLRPFTPRQAEVLALVLRGFKTAEIADKSGLSIKAVESHRKSVLDRIFPLSKPHDPERHFELLVAEVVRRGTLVVDSVSVKSPCLTPKQIEVKKCIQAGRSDREIAEELGISKHTVESHKGALFLAYGVKNRRQFVRMATADDMQQERLKEAEANQAEELSTFEP